MDWCNPVGYCTLTAGRKIMKLIGKSILGGIIGVTLPLLMTIDGNQVSSGFAFAMWMMGFSTPSLYV
jgi:hypothetical protein